MLYEHSLLCSPLRNKETPQQPGERKEKEGGERGEGKKERGTMGGGTLYEIYSVFGRREEGEEGEGEEEEEEEEEEEVSEGGGSATSITPKMGKRENGGAIGGGMKLKSLGIIADVGGGTRAKTAR